MNAILKTSKPILLAACLLASFTALSRADDNPFYIEGYPGATSVVAGEEIAFHVSSTTPKFSVQITRLGAENQVVWTKKDLPGQLHPVPEDASANGCHWPETFRVPVDPKWKTGYYTATFRIADSGGKWTQRSKRTAEAGTHFIVRPADPGKNTKILLQLCTNTYNAYNNWGGFSVYGGYRGSHGQFIGEKASYKVHRPDHWVFEGTGLKRDDEFGGKDTIVGYETDGCELEWRDGLPFPTCKDGTPKSFEVLATCPVRWHPDDAEWYERWEVGHSGNACMGIYTQGGTVFTAATTDWAHGLQGKDKDVDRITRNVLDRLSKRNNK